MGFSFGRTFRIHGFESDDRNVCKAYERRDNLWRGCLKFTDFEILGYPSAVSPRVHSGLPLVSCARFTMRGSDLMDE
jgi:hypothetical protein